MEPDERCPCFCPAVQNTVTPAHLLYRPLLLLPWQRFPGQECPLTPGTLTFDPGVTGGGAGGHLKLKGGKSTSLIGCHSPSPHPHLCNWHIDRADLYIVSSILSSLHRIKVGCWRRLLDMLFTLSLCTGVSTGTWKDSPTSFNHRTEK